MPTSKLTVWVGTRKGVDGPHFLGSEVNHAAQDPREPKRMYAAVHNGWFGPHIHVSTNGGKTWKLSDEGSGLKYVPNESLKRVWNICAGHADEPLLSTQVVTRAFFSAARIG